MESSGAERESLAGPAAEASLAAVMARLETLVDWERRDRGAAMRVSLEPARDLLERLGDPQAGRPLVLVAGTKGKGSTLAWVESALLRAGLRTALFTSPHVESVEERLRLDGMSVSSGALAAGLERALAAREDALRAGTAARDATWFDLVIAGSADAARDVSIDVWLVEVGLGGRLDSTNALDPWVSGVTSIELEHTAVLGTTRTAIAREKAGVARAGRALVLGLTPGDPARASILEVATAIGARPVDCPAAGSIDARNRCFAGVLLDELGAAVRAAGRPFEPPRAALLDGLDPPRLPGRLERATALGGAPQVVLDGAHVPESLALVLADLAALPDLDGPLHVVFSCGRDKRVDELLKVLVGRAETLICSSLPEGRSPHVDELVERATRAGLLATGEPDPLRALAIAIDRARTDSGWVLVTGSLHLLGPLRARLRHITRESC